MKEELPCADWEWDTHRAYLKKRTLNAFHVTFALGWTALKYSKYIELIFVGYWAPQVFEKAFNISSAEAISSQGRKRTRTSQGGKGPGEAALHHYRMHCSQCQRTKFLSVGGTVSVWWGRLESHGFFLGLLGGWKFFVSAHVGWWLESHEFCFCQLWYEDEKYPCVCRREWISGQWS